MKDFAQLSCMKGKSALITGAFGHLGKTLSTTLAGLGADLILVDLKESISLEYVGLLTETFGISVQTYSCDLEREDDRKKLISEVLKIGKLDVLINNAAFVGTSNLEGWSTDFNSQSTNTWRRAFEVNLTAPFDLIRDLSPLLGIGSNGSIINIGSIYGQVAPSWEIYEGTGMSNPAAYATSKGGLVQLTRWLSTTLAPKIRVNSILPGGIYRGQDINFVSNYERLTPMGRMANEDDFIGAIGFLASDLSKYVTGQSINVDGGWTAR